MSLRLLYVAYPMVPVTPSVAGGAEQMLWTLEQEMASRGHHTTVAACAESEIAGRLLPTGIAPEIADAYEQRRENHERAVLAEIERSRQAGQPYDLVHDKSGSFWRRAAEADVPVLATLHLPRSFYPAPAFDSVPPNLFFNCVSHSQWKTFSGVPQVIGPIANGIRVADFPLRDNVAGDYLLWLGRICEEKGPHVAIDVAQRAGLPLIIAGQVHAYSYHQRYFEREIAPHLDGTRVRFLDRPSLWTKIMLLRHARALLVPSLVDETSCLVAMEAGACGTPVIGFCRGAIPEVVADGTTGFIVDTAGAMAAAIAKVREIDPRSCRHHVAHNFSAERMARDYERLYSRVIQSLLDERRAVA